jgi:hypothetical protein
VGVVAKAAFLENVHRVGVRFGEVVFDVAGEAASLETETAAAADAVTLRALDGCQRRMLPEGFERRGRIRSAEEADLLAAAFPDEHQAVFSGGDGGGCVKHVGKGLGGLGWLSVELEAAGRCRGDDIDGVAGKSGAVDRAQDLAILLRAGNCR